MDKTPYVVALIFVATITIDVLTAHVEPMWLRLLVFFVVTLSGGLTMGRMLRKYRHKPSD